jgi:hypothetical protein
MGRTFRLHGHKRNADKTLIVKSPSLQSPVDLKFKVFLVTNIFFLASSEFPQILRNSKLHYRIQKSLSLVPILRQIISNHRPIIFLKPLFNIITHLRLSLPSGLLISR